MPVPLAMPLAFSSAQHLQIPIEAQSDRLSSYLNEERRIIEALFEPRQLTCLPNGRYRYDVRRIQVFQLQIQPVIEMKVTRSPGRLVVEATDSALVGLEMVDDFHLTLDSWLQVSDGGLEGKADLGVSVSRPALLGLIPGSVLEATGGSLLGALLLGMKGRVALQLQLDYRSWCSEQDGA